MTRMHKTRTSKMSVDKLYVSVKSFSSRFFNQMGLLVGSHPVVFSLVPLFACLLLGLGMLRLESDKDTEKLFTPTDARIFHDRDRIEQLFPDSTAWNFDAFGLIKVPTLAVLIFRVGGEDKLERSTIVPADVDTDQEENTLYTDNILTQVQAILLKVKAIQVTDDDTTYGLEDLCARKFNRCVSDGDNYTTDSFRQEVEQGRVTFPNFLSSHGVKDLSWNLAGVLVSPAGILQAARVIKIRLFWRVDRSEPAKLWNQEFLKVMKKEKEALEDGLQVTFSTSESLETELLQGIEGDIVYFTLTIMLMILYSILVSTGGDMVSSRGLLACGGVLAAALGIVASLGFLCLVGVSYVNFVGLMPFLVLGIGVDDMFLLMSCWGETISETMDVPTRVALTFSKAGVGITITTLTDFLAFLIGINSDFIAVRQFCIFTAGAVLLCYVVNVTLFGACMSLHGDRVYASKHCLTCQKTKTREQLRLEGANTCKVFCCGGSIPTKSYQDESVCEKLPRLILPRLILNPITKVLISILFVLYLAWAVYGAIMLKPGMKYVDLVLRTSYYYQYSLWDEVYFGQRLAIAFVVDQQIDYAGDEGDVFRKLLNAAQRDPKINMGEDTFLRCWLHQYSRSPFYPHTRAQAANLSRFLQGLHQYLKVDLLSQNDIIFNQDRSAIVASRCYVLTINEVAIFEQSELMVRMRMLVDDISAFKVFVFQPVFVMLEHTIAILPSTLQTVGTAVAVMFFVTSIMLPQLLMVSLVTLNIIFIITCVFGSMYWLEISFSGISLIHILMSIGFSVDFSAHICAAYLIASDGTREERARYALVHASGPILNGGISSLLGVSLLMLSESYFFRTFFKVMSMVILAGAINAVFFMPIVLSVIGPESMALQPMHRMTSVPRPKDSHLLNTQRLSSVRHQDSDSHYKLKPVPEEEEEEEEVEEQEQEEQEPGEDRDTPVDKEGGLQLTVTESDVDPVLLHSNKSKSVTITKLPDVMEDDV